jgi:hypothetical protein
MWKECTARGRLMTDIILLIFEGEKTERMIYDNMIKLFFSGRKNVVFVPYKVEIYQLWKQIKDEEFFNLIGFLQERGDEVLRDISRRQVSEIHLFFDHDAHSHAATMTQAEYNDVICAMLNTFNNEYRLGKLWISYPMAEALKHCKKDAGLCFSNCVWKIAMNTEYKKTINTISDYLDARHFTRAD